MNPPQKQRVEGGEGARVNATGQRRVRCGTWPSRRRGRRRDARHSGRGSVLLLASRPSSSRSRTPSCTFALPPPPSTTTTTPTPPADYIRTTPAAPAGFFASLLPSGDPLSRRSATRRLNRREHAAAPRPAALRVSAFSSTVTVIFLGRIPARASIESTPRDFMGTRRI